jgi:hypothetical protein
MIIDLNTNLFMYKKTCIPVLFGLHVFYFVWGNVETDKYPSLLTGYRMTSIV